MRRILIGGLIFAIYVACVIAAAFSLHFSGTKFALFCIVLGVLGAATIALALWYMSGMASTSGGQGGTDFTNLDSLLHDADRKLRASHHGLKSIAAAQIIYIVGEANSAKTQTVLQSGLDVELLAGNLLRDEMVAPTQSVNIWLASSLIVLEGGGALLREPAVWRRLIKSTRPRSLGAVFSKSSSQSPRAVVVCVSIERVPGPTEAGYDRAEIRGSAQTLNERLREISQTLGTSVPIYVIFTKLDTLAHFADYAGRLTAEEVKLPLGSLLGQVDAGPGLFAERASQLFSSRLDELIHGLAEFRIDILSRGGELKQLSSAYEFPRDLQKRRDTIVDFLVELVRPSQLGINPFLRGFFFSGMRAVIVEEVAAGPIQPQRRMPVDAGATQIFSLGGAPIQASLQPVRSGSRKVPQWAFLPYLFSKLLLSDKSALEVSRSSTGVTVLRRALLAGLCGCIAVYILLICISFNNNRRLEQQEAAAALISVNRYSSTGAASIQDLQALNQLGDLLLTLDSYRKDGAPIMDRWGLYSGNVLYPIACKAYVNKFRALLLAPTQQSILAKLRALPSSPQAGADYNATYNPLKAYLITTSNPEKSAVDPEFLAPVLSSEWAAAFPSQTDVAGLAPIQFKTYATLLAEPQSCMASERSQPDQAVLDSTRDYLKNFGGPQHIYQNMLANANSRNPAVHFNDNPNYPNSAQYIIDAYRVPGAFTKPGFAFMQNAIQHPDTYFNGDEWVLGPNAVPSVDRATLSSQILKLYVAEYLSQWRAYLNAARFVGFQSWSDAAKKLNYLDSPQSPILELFSLISINTAVSPDIAKAFQAPQSIVPPTNPGDRFLADTNQLYIKGLQGLESAVDSVNQNPASVTDPNAGVPVIQAVVVASQAAESLRGNFNPDPEGKIDSVTFNRLEDPINSTKALAKTKIDPSGGGGAAFCGQASRVLSKFPFNPQSTAEASPEDVAAIFSSQGALAQLYLKINQLVIPQGNQYVANPASGVSINPAFLRFFNAAEKTSDALFPLGTTQPSLTFTLTEVKTPGVPDYVLNIDNQQLATAGQKSPIHWVSAPSSKITIQGYSDPITGPWSVFKFGFLATHPTRNRLEYTFSLQGQTSHVLRFDAEGPGAPLLDPSFMGQLQHCVSNVTRQ